MCFSIVRVGDHALPVVRGLGPVRSAGDLLMRLESRRFNLADISVSCGRGLLGSHFACAGASSGVPARNRMLRVVREFLWRGVRAGLPIQPRLDQRRGELGRELQIWFSLPAPGPLVPQRETENEVP